MDYNYYNSTNTPNPKKKKSKAGFLLKVIVAAVIFGLVSGGVSYGVYRGADLVLGKKGLEETGSLRVGNNVSGTAVSTAVAVDDVSDIAENVMPAIVQVTNMSVVEYRGFFGQVYSEPAEAAGSGVIIADDTDLVYIATNNHVVSNSQELTITFLGDEAVEAQLKGTYPQKDVAVVTVKKSDIPEDTLKNIKVATIADSDKNVVGQAVVAIGNALGYGQSVTTGVISALNREVSIPDETSGEIYTNELIQTDAAINPGNSGGALLNMNGEVIGVVSAKYSDTSVEGMGYAIPINDAMEIVNSIIKTGSYKEKQEKPESIGSSDAYLGIYGGMDIDQNTASKYGIPTGVYVSQVDSDSPAEKAGIESGDIIRAVDGHAVVSISELQAQIANYSPGDEVNLTVADCRDNYKDISIKVELAKKK